MVSPITIKIKKVQVDEEGKVVKMVPTNRITKTKGRGDPDPNGFYNGHWQFPEQLGGEGFFGFIYAIFDPDTKRGYIGKKQYVGAGKLNKGQESDWRRYTSSCKELAEAIRQRGILNFKFIVLEQYKIRGTLTYAETWTQCKVETPTSDVWYNTRIEDISWPVREHITDRHKQRLEEVVRMLE